MLLHAQDARVRRQLGLADAAGEAVGREVPCAAVHAHALGPRRDVKSAGHAHRLVTLQGTRKKKTKKEGGKKKKKEGEQGEGKKAKKPRKKPKKWKR